MAVNINKLVTGSMGVGTSEVLDLTKTRFTLQGGTVETYNITGTLDSQWMIDNGYIDPEPENDDDAWLKTITQADIGNTVTSIGEWTFCECNSLTSVTIPSSVTSIGDYAFAECSSLTIVTLENGVTNIGIHPFANTNIKNIVIPSSLNILTDGIFSGMTLEDQIIPETVQIMDRAFGSDCYGTVIFQNRTIQQIQEIKNSSYGQEGYEWYSYPFMYNYQLVEENPDMTLNCTDGNVLIKNLTWS